MSTSTWWPTASLTTTDAKRPIPSLDTATAKAVRSLSMTDELPRRVLGRTGLEVTQLGFGAMELRGAPRGPEISDEVAAQVLQGVLDSGINYIDTSIDYGVAEERIGQFISCRRSE